jgi:hypothetical protein
VQVPSPIIPRLRDAVLIGACALFGMGVCARAALAPRHPSDGVAVIYSPWTTGEVAFTHAVAAGARFVRFGALPSIVVVIPDDPSEYPRRAAAFGAWMLADPQALAGCFTDRPATGPR